MAMGNTSEPKGHDRYDKLNLIAECATLFGSKYYHSFLPGIEDMLKMSRDRAFYKDPTKHIGLQLGLLQAISEVEQAASEGKKIARDKKDEAFRVQSRRNKFAGKAYRQIADGIAWRSFGFSRFTVRVLSQAHSPGAAWGKDVGRNKEKQRAINVVRNGGFVLIHDATNCLRVGDLSSMDAVPSNKPYLAEVKNKELITPSSVSRKMKQNKKTDKQEFRLYQAQVMITDRMFFVENDVPVVDIKPNMIDLVSSAGAVMKKAMKEGVAAKMVAPYMLVEATDMPTLMQLGDYQERLDAIPHPGMEPFFQQSNYDYLQLLGVEELSRNVPPYSIFPLPLQTVAKLITGELLVTATIYEQPLRELFSRYGWDMTVDYTVLEKYQAKDEADRVQFFSDQLLFPGSDDVDEWVHIKNRRTGFIFPVASILARMPHEFTSVQHIVSVAEEVMKLCKPGEATLLYPDVLDARRWL